MKKLERAFLPKNFHLQNWESVENYFNLLMGVKLENENDVEAWLQDVSELAAVLSENLAWRYINTTRETDNLEFQAKYQEFVNEIYPNVAKAWDEVYDKLLSYSKLSELENKGYHTYIRKIAADKRLFRKENLQPIADAANLAQEYSKIMGSLSVLIRDEEYTSEEAQALLSEPDRDLREETYYALNKARFEESEDVDILLNELISKRSLIAKNAGFNSFLDYQFVSLNRFDYTVQDCQKLHESIKNQTLPLLNKVYQDKAKALGLDSLRPWDIYVDSSNKEVLKPTKNTEELLQKSKLILGKVDSSFVEVIESMEELGHLDLGNRMGKAPGGYNYPLYESGVPYIFMNAVGHQSDLTTFIHESGHAVHSVLSSTQNITGFKELGSEIAELASMSMELFTMEHWDVIFNEEELKRAKRHQIEKILMILPHVAAIDKFQHWIYVNPEHTLQERRNAWLDILAELSSSEVNWFGLDRFKRQSWQSVPHIFSVPLYFIEYAIAQLGAVAMWKNYKLDPKETIRKYKEALSLGSSKTIPEMYETAGIKFDFSEDYVAELSTFLYQEYQALNE